MKNITKKIVFALAMVLTMGLAIGTTSEAAKARIKSVKITSPTSKSTYTMKRYDKDAKKQLKVKVSVSGKISKDVTYKSSNSKVVSVSKTGMLTAKKAGTATITVKAKKNSKKKDTIKITVKQMVTSVKASVKKPISSFNGVATLQKGKKYTVSAKVAPKSASNKKVSYKSSKPSVAKIDSKGRITAKKAGTAKITVTAKDGSKEKATITVYVTKKITKKVKSVKAEAAKTELKMGETTTVKATVSPSNATLKKVAFKSSNTKVAKVDAASGKVTAVAPGTAKITVQAMDGSKKKTTVTITVKNDITSIAFAEKEYKVFVGKKVTVKADVNADAYDTTVTYSIDDASKKYATVDEKTGEVTAIAKGVVDVKATSADGKQTATVKVVITDEVVTTVTLKDNAVAKATVKFDGDKTKVEADVLDLLKKAGLTANSSKAVTVNGKAYTAKYDGTTLTFDGKKISEITANEGVVEVTVGANAKKFLSGLQMANFTSGSYEYKVTVGKHEFTKLVLGDPYITAVEGTKTYKFYAENGVVYFVGDVKADLADLADIADIK